METARPFPIKALLMIIVFGAVVGLMWPTPRAAAPPVAADAPAVPRTPDPAAIARATDKAIDTVINRSADGHFYVDAMVNDHLVHFMIDTGASIVVLTKADALAIGEHFSESEFEVVARGASGDVRGKNIKLHHVSIGQKDAWDIDAAITEDGLDVSLLGQSYLAQVGEVSIVGDKMTLR
jgi:aspartyl protease family protein